MNELRIKNSRPEEDGISLDFKGKATINGKEYEGTVSELRKIWVIANNPGVFNEDGSIQGMHDLSTIKQPEIVYE